MTIAAGPSRAAATVATASTAIAAHAVTRNPLAVQPPAGGRLRETSRGGAPQDAICGQRTFSTTFPIFS